MILALEGTISQLKEDVSELEGMIVEKDGENSELRELINAKQAEIDKQLKVISNHEVKDLKQEKEISDLESTLEALNNRLNILKRNMDDFWKEEEKAIAREAEGWFDK